MLSPVMLSRPCRSHALVLDLLVLALLFCQPAVPQPAPVMQRVLANAENLRHNDMQVRTQYLQQQAKEAQTAARYQAALKKNSRGAREAARLATLRAKHARPVSVIATLTEGSMLAAWALASPQEGKEAVLALSAVRVDVEMSHDDARQHVNALPSDITWLVATGLGAEHTYTIEVNGKEVLTQQSNSTLAAGLALSGEANRNENSKATQNDWAEGKIGDQTYYYRSAEPHQIFWEVPDIALPSAIGNDEL
eukprot:COSAG02_NODE_3638_length_6442_cov_6.391297_3_plen_251_part_00